MKPKNDFFIFEDEQKKYPLNIRNEYMFMISLSFAGRFVNSFLMAKGTFGVDKLFFKLYNFFVEEDPVLF